MAANLWEYRAAWLHVVDGDTIDVRVDVGFDHNGLGMRLRLLGVDTPERKGDTRLAGDLAMAFTNAWLQYHADPKGRVFLRTARSPHDVDKDDSFGRYLATVYNLVDGETCGDHCLNAALLDSGNAVPYVR